jgi:putative addiction module killer protein
VAAGAECPSGGESGNGAERIADGNLSNVRTVGGGVLEYRIDFGPGYRVYLGRDGDRLVILLVGGTKKRQQTDIREAKANWEDYRRRKP